MTFSHFRAPRLISTAALAFALMLGAASAHEIKTGELEIQHPWSREAVHGAKVAAGFVVIKNNGTTPDRLLSATGEIAGRTEIHSMSVDAAGVMTMRQLTEGVEIPAGGTVELKPGGNHIMLMELSAQPKAGEKFKGTLTFEKAGKVDIEFAVDKPKPGQQTHEGHGG